MVTKSQRLDRYGAFSVCHGNHITITEDQFVKLERAGRRSFNEDLRTKISSTLEDFITRRKGDNVASTLEQQAKKLNDTQKALSILCNIFSTADIRSHFKEGAIRETGYHAAARALHRIEDQLKFPLQYNRDDNDAVWEQRKDFLQDRERPIGFAETQALMNQHEQEPLVDLEEFGNNLNWLRIACNKAITALDNETKADGGAQKIDSDLYLMLTNLDYIYDKAAGKTRGRLSFIYETLLLIPENIRPRYSSDLASLRKRLELAKAWHLRSQKKKKVRQ